MSYQEYDENSETRWRLDDEEEQLTVRGRWMQVAVERLGLTIEWAQSYGRTAGRTDHAQVILNDL
jgi:hypothetical protein